jgi:hypothetical protein
MSAPVVRKSGRRAAHLLAGSKRARRFRGSLFLLDVGRQVVDDGLDVAAEGGKDAYDRERDQGCGDGIL